jgi:hypothetical protein
MIGIVTTQVMTEEERTRLSRRIQALELEHKDLNDVIERLGQLPTQDALQLQRLKKRKLMLKDQIEQLKLRLVPDIPA